MEIGILAKEFDRHNVVEVIQAVQDYDMNCVQFNLSCANLPSLPLEFDKDTFVDLGRTIRESGIEIAGLSGTFNMIHPVMDVREKGLIALENLAKASRYLGTNVITLCTGSRDINNMWKFHPDNNSREAWEDLIKIMERALVIAEKYNVILGIEPELSNVINTAEKGMRLLETFQTDHLKIIMDGANLIPFDQIDKMHYLLDEAFDLLGENIILAHAKDFSVEQQEFVAAGKGDLDYEYYISLLKSSGYNGPLILHGLNEEQVSESHAYLKELI
ncbi:sugar phosphate isomerase/epimerase family protein [Lederbergia citrea]|uniref:Sugar phosphate isomerase/epimerase n=1 Tax=Lederbergia citrea TaxID=2833581 RepID=A0A942UH07_9BACI|nr:sugar phosphate isomerase/epimerase family protein [Lederbergia citrea]MBS4204140.1 sugar phosphate isomerase/epimerase [Lederbergia citrea]MBS4221275.1 sugar phosphate isomerase/epimerase [Lederbergia citrea]